MIGASQSTNFRTIVFDCDGVILDSNRIKTEAFLKVALRFGKDAAEELVRFHVNNGGISRYRKFEYLFTHILHRQADSKEIASLASEYGEQVYNELLTCPISPGLAELRNATMNKDWMIVSGGDTTELNRVFVERGIASMFNQGIHGSPATKDDILRREATAGGLKHPAIFLGDSRYDHEAATRAGLSFIFISEWTEFLGWREYCEAHSIISIACISKLMPLLSDSATFDIL